MSIPSTNTSGYRGVSQIKSSGKWRSRVTVKGKRINLGLFDTLEEASIAYNTFVLENGLEKNLRSNMTKKEYSRYYYHQNPEKMRTRATEYRNRNIEKIRLKQNEIYKTNKSKISLQMKEKHRKLKIEIINAYGGKCECCGESNIDFLTIDHINNDGKKHTKEVRCGTGGTNFYKWIKKNNFPKDILRLLCWNCNCARAHNPDKKCPHEIEREKLFKNENLY